MTEYELRSLLSRDVLALGEEAGNRKQAEFGNRVFVVDRYIFRDTGGTLPALPGGRCPGGAVVDVTDLGPEEAVKRIAEVRSAGFSGSISGPTASDVWRWAEGREGGVRRWLEALRDAGLSLLRGDDAELLVDGWRARRNPALLPQEAWLAIHREAHRLGLQSTASVRYGSGEAPDERVAHLLRLSALQRETGGLLAVRPEPWDPERWPVDDFLDLPLTTGLEDLRMVAVCRLAFPGVHVEVSWRMVDDKLAQTALRFGADTLSAASWRRWPEPAGEEGPEISDLDQAARLVRESGWEPVLVDETFRFLPQEGNR